VIVIFKGAILPSSVITCNCVILLSVMPAIPLSLTSMSEKLTNKRCTLLLTSSGYAYPSFTKDSSDKLPLSNSVACIEAMKVASVALAVWSATASTMEAANLLAVDSRGLAGLSRSFAGGFTSRGGPQSFYPGAWVHGVVPSFFVRPPPAVTAPITA
jgi:hypothetical protein